MLINEINNKDVYYRYLFQLLVLNLFTTQR